MKRSLRDRKTTNEAKPDLKTKDKAMTTNNDTRQDESMVVLPEPTMVPMTATEREILVAHLPQAARFAPPQFDVLAAAQAVDVDLAAAATQKWNHGDEFDTSTFKRSYETFWTDPVSAFSAAEARAVGILVVGELALRGRPRLANWISAESPEHAFITRKHGGPRFEFDDVQERQQMSSATFKRITDLRNKATAEERRLAQGGANGIKLGAIAKQVYEKNLYETALARMERAEKALHDEQVATAEAARQAAEDAEQAAAEAGKVAAVAEAEIQAERDREQRQRQMQRDVDLAERSRQEADRLRDEAAEAQRAIGSKAS